MSEEEVAVLMERLDNLIKKQASDEANAQQWREKFCTKVDKILERFNSLPCKERGEMYRGLRVREGLIWASIGIIGALLFFHLGWR